MQWKTRVGTLGICVLLWVPHSVAEPNAQDAQLCEMGARHMIEVAQQSLRSAQSRPERIEKRRKLVEDWQRRLDKGEDACAVYADIQKAATTF